MRVYVLTAVAFVVDCSRRPTGASAMLSSTENCVLARHQSWKIGAEFTPSRCCKQLQRRHPRNLLEDHDITENLTYNGSRD